MTNPLRLLILAGLGVGAWYFFTHFQVQGLENIALTARGADGGTAPAPVPAPPAKDTIRIATANFSPLDQAKLNKPAVVGRLADMIRQFDLVALQGIQAPDQALLVQLLEVINGQGRRYQFVTPPHVGRDLVRQYCALVYDADMLQLDRTTVGLVADRTGRFRQAPFQQHGTIPAQRGTLVPTARADRRQHQIEQPLHRRQA